MAARKTPAAPTAQTHETFAAAFHAAQQEMPAIQKDAINPHLRNRYASLASIIPTVLETAGRHGLIVIQLPSTIGSHPAVLTRIEHVQSAGYIEDRCIIPLGGKDTGHAYGSGLTYMRRYAITAAFGLVTESDDDGNGATPDVGGAQVPSSAPAAPASTDDAAFGASL